MSGTGDAEVPDASGGADAGAPDATGEAAADGSGLEDVAVDSGPDAPSCAPDAGAYPGGSVYPAGTMPAMVRLADLDGDGSLDLVVVDESGYTPGVNVLLGRGDGTFATAVYYASGSGPMSLAVADLDGDGRLDVALADGLSHSVRVLLNAGGGKLAPDVAFPAGDFAVSLTAADLDGDGHVDLAASSPGDTPIGELVLLFNDGHGGFGAPGLTPTSRNARFITASDVDADGHVDLVLAVSDQNAVGVLRGDGAGHFAAMATYPVGMFPISVASADLDGDGKPDLVAANDDVGYLSLLPGAGDAGLGPEMQLTNWQPFSYAATADSVAVADLDGDGRPEIIEAINYPTSVGHVAVFHNLGGGRFAAPVAHVSGAMPESVAVGDVDRDGIPDLVASSSYDGTVSVIRSRCGP